MKLLSISTAMALLAGATFAMSAPARASTFVLGDGMAHDCSVAALAGSTSLDTIELCTIALDTEMLSDSDEAKTFVNRAVVYLRSGHLDNCRKDLVDAERLMPNLAEIYINRGALMIHTGRYQEAVNEINKGLALSPSQPEKAYFNRGLANEGLNETRAAYYDYRKAQEISPSWPAAARAIARFQVQSTR